MAAKLSLMGMTLLFGAGSALAFADMTHMSAWVAAVTATCSAFGWMGRMVWKAAADRQAQLDQMAEISNRLNRLLSEFNERLASHEHKLDMQAEQLSELNAMVKSVTATCAARAPIINAAAIRLANLEDDDDGLLDEV